MSRGVLFLAILVLLVGVRAAGGNSQSPVQSAGGGWTIPATAAAEKNPLIVNDAVLAAGKKLFADKCQRCHGPQGKGDGPDGEADRQQDMNLTVAGRAARNPDGVVFYKLWNGRTSPKMPSFSADLSKEQAWAIVAFVQTLRAKTGGAR